MGNTHGTQQTFYDHFVEKMEAGLVHSWRCKWTNVVMKWRYQRRTDDEMIPESYFSADFEFRPANAECCEFYSNVSILPFIVHDTDKNGVRRKDAVIVCGDELGKNFKVHKHCLLRVLDLYIPELQAACIIRRVVIGRYVFWTLEKRSATRSMLFTTPASEARQDTRV
jgi:hypothetical protein